MFFVDRNRQIRSVAEISLIFIWLRKTKAIFPGQLGQMFCFGAPNNFNGRLFAMEKIIYPL